MTGQTVGYVRVSSLDQNTDRQLDRHQLDRVFTDRLSARTPPDLTPFAVRLATAMQAQPGVYARLLGSGTSAGWAGHGGADHRSATRGRWSRSRQLPRSGGTCWHRQQRRGPAASAPPRSRPTARHSGRSVHLAGVQQPHPRGKLWLHVQHPLPGGKRMLDQANAPDRGCPPPPRSAPSSAAPTPATVVTRRASWHRRPAVASRPGPPPR
jgi:hypothetical protein